MKARVTVQVSLEFDVDQQQTTEQLIEHVLREGDILSYDVSFGGFAPTVAQPASGEASQGHAPVNNPGSAVSVPPPSEDSAGAQGQAVSESAEKPARAVTITQIRAKASEMMAADAGFRDRLRDLLAAAGVTNMTALGELSQDVLNKFWKELA